MFSLILAMLILGGIAWFWEDYTNYPYKFFGMAWWAMAVFLGFALGILYYALFVLPIPGSEGWAEGLRLLTRNYLNPPPKADQSRKGQRKRGKKAAADPLAELPPSFKSLKCGILRSHQALVITKGGGFARAAGPGFVTLFKKEGTRQIIDVRKHSRSTKVAANTRDGIPVEFFTFVDFRVWQSDEAITAGNVIYHYDPEAIFQVSYTDNTTDTDKLRRWSDIVVPLAVNAFVTEIGRYTLEQFYEIDSNGQGPMNEIKQRVRRSLERSDRLEGVEILGVGAGNLILPDSMREQQIKRWQAQWQREIMLKKAKGDAEANLRLKHARARAQIDLIENITQNIASAQRSSNISLTEIVALRMIETMEDAVSDISLQALVPQPVLNSMVESSRQMISWIEEDGDDAP